MIQQSTLVYTPETIERSILKPYNSQEVDAAQYP